MIDSQPEHSDDEPITQASTQPTSGARDVVFVDSRVVGAATLLADLSPGTQLVFLDANTNGLQQMASYLAGHPAGSVQVVAHGTAGQLWLGSTFLDSGRLEGYKSELATIGQSLDAGGDILFYSCDLAAGTAGIQFVQAVSALTGADIAASDDRTGAGGDWTLEITTGNIEARPALSTQGEAAYDHALSTITVTSNADSGAGSLRAALAAASGGDTITFSSGMTITLTSGQLVIDRSITVEGDLDGNGTPDVTLDADYNSRVLYIASGTVALDGLVLQHGLVSGDGGASGSTSSGFSPYDSGDDGAGALGAALLIGAATVTLINGSIINNRAAGGGGGGATTGGGGGWGGGGGGGIPGQGWRHGRNHLRVRLPDRYENLRGGPAKHGRGWQRRVE